MRLTVGSARSATRAMELSIAGGRRRCWRSRSRARSPTRPSPRSTGCPRWRRWSGNPSWSPPPDRRRGCLGVPAWPELHHRTRSRHLLRLRRRGDVGQMANHEGRAPLTAKAPAARSSTPVAIGVRPDRRPRRGMGPDREAPGLRLGAGAGRQAPGALMQSAARYPNIKAGQDFTGYS
jgi:hypothetical protein